MHVASVIPILMASIDISVTIVHMQTAAMEAAKAQLAYKKKRKRGSGGSGIDKAYLAFVGDETDEEALEIPHEKQVLDLIAWHCNVLDTKWYVKPRSTCWFDKYLFNIHTPEMFYDILRMRRRTFDRIVHDLRPFIQGQAHALETTCLGGKKSGCDVV